jgi:hypothetical protein
MVTKDESDVAGFHARERPLQKRLARRQDVLVVVIFAEPRSVDANDADSDFAARFRLRKRTGVGLDPTLLAGEVAS